MDIVFFLYNETTRKTLEVEVAMTEPQYVELMDTDEFDEFVKGLETKFNGVLDASGACKRKKWHLGFGSYEIEGNDFPKVLEEFKKFFAAKGYASK